MKHITTLALILVFYTASAQRMLDLSTDNQTISFKEILLNLNGQTNIEKVDYVDGSPYFKQEWLPASVTISSGKRYDGLQMRLNLLSGEVLFKNEQGVQLVAQTGIQRIEWKQGADRFVFVNATMVSNPGSNHVWYQQLDSGTVSLYKQLEKVIVETTPYNSATVEKSIETKERFYILKNRTLIPVKKTKDVLEALNDQAESLQKQGRDKQAFSEKTLVETINYYNSLVKQETK